VQLIVGMVHLKWLKMTAQRAVRSDRGVLRGANVTLAPSKLMVTNAVRRVCLMDVVPPRAYLATVQQQLFHPTVKTNSLV
jgi:hypothetical protein